jgi:PHD/YefM family antitoxin component YafN of YafNO toxin-antitoxin module
MTTISLDRVEARLSDAVEHTKTGPVVVEASGQAVAILLSPEEYRRLTDAEARERDRLDQAAYDKVFGPFERGEFRELTEQEWRDLIDGKRKSEHDPDSWALPPRVAAR